MNDDLKSRGEVYIADFLKAKRIKYKYEHPLAVVDRGKIRVWYPDFTLPEYGIIIEFAGINNDSSYSKTIEHKREVYIDNGIEAIFLTEQLLREGLQDYLMNEIGRIVSTRFGRFQEFFR